MARMIRFKHKDNIEPMYLIVRTMYFNSRILKPIREMCSSTKGIIAGNYDLEVVRTYEKVIGENEVGDLTFSFELMRDELKEKQLDINPQEVYFLEYFILVMKELEVFVKQKEMDFCYEIKTFDMLVNVDKRRIIEVLYNLVENSIKYICEKRGSIVIEAEQQRSLY